MCFVILSIITERFPLKKSHFDNHLADLLTYPFENKFKRQKNGAETIKSEMLNIN